MSLLKRVEPHLHLINISQRNDAGEPYKKEKINLNDQKDYVYALGVVETFVKNLLSSGRIQVGRQGNGWERQKNRVVPFYS